MSALSGTLQLTFTSDWHCGTGQGRHGGVGRVVARDADGLPYVPARTLRGLWRDACEKAATGLDDGQAGEWTRLVHRIFGAAAAGNADDPDEAAGLLQVRPARLPDAWRAYLTGLPSEATPPSPDPALQAMLSQALVVERYGVKIDPASGVADDDTLRLVERTRAGLTVEAPFQVRDGQEEWAVDLLLQAGAALWHHVGSSRRRGAGRCLVSLEGVSDLAGLLSVHDAADIEAFSRVGSHVAVAAPTTTPSATTQAVPAKPAAPSSVGATAPAAAGAPARHATITITTELPVICGRGVQGNVATGLDFVPGATLLPVVAKSLGGRAAGLIRQGRILVSDATPVIGGQQSAPSPRVLMSADKGRAWRLPDGTPGPVFHALETSHEVGKPIGGWTVCDADAWQIGSLGLTMRAHANIDDATQRPDTDGLYTFEAIPAGTLLRFTLEAEPGAVSDQEWQQMLAALDDSEQSLGRYRGGDYGKVHFAVTDDAGVSDASSEATSEDSADSLPRFDVWLISDAHLVDECGMDDPTAERLATALGGLLGTSVTVVSAQVSVSRRDSWTATRTLPRPSRICLAAGSVVRLSADPPVAAEELQAALDRGVGSSRVEGFGRLRLLTTFPDKAVPAQVEAAAPAKAGPAPDDEAWQTFTRLAWEREIRGQIRQLSSVEKNRRTIIGTSKKKAQRGTLREAARMLARDERAVARWLDATRSDEQKSQEWGADVLERLTTIAHPTAGGAGWAGRLAGLLNGLDEREGLLPVPADLAGLSPATLAAALIGECLAQQGRHDSRSGGAR